MLSMRVPLKYAAPAVASLLVAYLVARHFAAPAEAQAPPALQRPADPFPPPLAEPPTTRGQPALRDMGIDQLAAHVKTLREQRAELEKREKEAVTLLREKLKEQRQRLQQLGIPLEEPAPPQADPVPPALPSSPK